MHRGLCVQPESWLLSQVGAKQAGLWPHRESTLLNGASPLGWEYVWSRLSLVMPLPTALAGRQEGKTTRKGKQCSDGIHRTPSTASAPGHPQALYEGIKLGK